MERMIRGKKKEKMADNVGGMIPRKELELFQG